MAVRKPLVMIGGVVRGLPDDDSLSSSSEWTAEVVTQAEAEAGTATTARKWTAQRVRQAITGWWSGIGTAFGKSLLSLADAAAGRTALGLGNVDNTSDADKPISTATANALNDKFDKTGGAISGPFGYGPGAGGTVVQPTSRVNTVTLNKPCGVIETAATEMSAGQAVSFTFINNQINPTGAAGDQLVVNIFNSLTFKIDIVTVWGTGAALRLTNISNSSTTEVARIVFTVIKGAST